MKPLAPTRFPAVIRFACVAALAFAALAQQAGAEPLTLTFSHAAVTTDPRHLGALQFAKRVEERTNGQIKIEVYPQSELGSTSEVLQKVQLGSIDMDVPSLDYLIKFDRTFAVVVMPYLFDNEEHAYRVLDGPAMGWFGQLAEKQGFVILSNWEGGFRNLTNNKRPVNKPEDVRGLKVRVLPVAELEDAMQSLGAQISKIRFPELYLALSNGTVDGQENPIRSIYYNKLYEVQRYLALTRHAYFTTLHVISARTWAKLTPAQQQILREESKIAGDAMRKRISAEESALIARMIASGIVVTHPDPKPFRAATAAARGKIAQYAGEANAQRFIKMVDDERSH